MIDNTDKWNRYWAGNRVSACMQDADGNYTDAIGQHWEQLFSGLPAGSSVLDLATGNGAVIHFALRVAQRDQSALKLTGVDLAEIDPWAHLDKHQLEPATVEFLPLVNIEQLPFEPDTFDSVVSQYGAEYGDLEHVLQQVHKVIKPGGKLQWIMHSTDSNVYANAQREITDAGFMLDTEQVAQAMLGLLKIQEQQGKFMPESHRQTAGTAERQAMDQALQNCMQRLRRQPSEILDHGLQNLAFLYQHREQHSPAEISDKINEWEVEIRVYQQRLQALVASAIDADKRAVIERCLQQLGFSGIHFEAVKKTDKAIIGLLLQAQNAPC